MGSYVTKLVDEQAKKSQEFIVGTQDNMFSRQLQMQNYMREQALAMQVARSRDMFMWWAGFYVTIAAFGTMAYRKTKKPGPLIPLIPLAFIGAYQYDMGYGSKLKRMQNDARKILKDTTNLLELPTGLPTIEILDERKRISSQDTEKDMGLLNLGNMPVIEEKLASNA